MHGQSLKQVLSRSTLPSRQAVAPAASMQRQSMGQTSPDMPAGSFTSLSGQAVAQQQTRAAGYRNANSHAESATAHATQAAGHAAGKHKTVRHPTPDLSKASGPGRQLRRPVQAPGHATGIHSSPLRTRAATSNSYLAKSGHAADVPSSAARSSSPAQAHSSIDSPAAMSQMKAAAARAGSLGLSPRCSSSTAAAPDRLAAGRSTSLANFDDARMSRPARAGQAKPGQAKLPTAESRQSGFIQTLRDWGLGPVSSGPLTQPMWQPYQRHVTPERSSARSALARRALAQKALALQGSHSPGLTGAGTGAGQQHKHAHPGVDRISVAQPWTAASSFRHTGPRSQVVDNEPHSPDPSSDPSPGATGTALKPSLGRLWGRSLSPLGTRPQSSKPHLSPPAQAGHSPVPQEQVKSGKPKAKPIRAGQLATAALQTKQVAWEHTRTHSMPSLLSQVTELLRCNSEPLLLMPERSASELMYAAAPQLGHTAPQPATAVGWDMEADAPAEHLQLLGNAEEQAQGSALRNDAQQAPYLIEDILSFMDQTQHRSSAHQTTFDAKHQVADALLLPGSAGKAVQQGPAWHVAEGQARMNEDVLSFQAQSHQQQICSNHSNETTPSAQQALVGSSGEC